MALTEHRLVDEPSALAQAAEWLADLDPIAVDVERADSDRYYRRAALIQVGGGGRVALVDPLALGDLSQLSELLASRTTILHAAENDLVPLAASGVEVGRVEDTAIVAAILGLPTGLEGLLRDLLGVELDGDKARMQRADWSRRPLDDEMLNYAAGDVADLPELWEELAARLEETGRMSWYREELAATLALPPVEERRDWTRVKGAGRLDATGKARLHSLWDFREELARRTDTAPGLIAGDKTLVNLAVSRPRSRGELAKAGVRRKAIKRFGADILQAVEAVEAVEPEPSRRDQRPVEAADRDLADELRQIRSHIAEEIGVDAGVLCPSRTLVGGVVADPGTPDELRVALDLRDWQWALVGDAFWEALVDAREGRTRSDDEEEVS